MKVAAIISEYNPFHNGHALQIEHIRRTTDADRIIAIMSGDFTERGEPSVFSKEARTRAALASGIDAVFLLPVAYSTAGAELFAKGGVAIAAGLKADYLCFGSECGDIDKLLEAARVIKDRGTADSPEILKLMSEGHTFAKARSLAFPEYEAILSSPNNVLALEYIIAALTMNTDLSFVTCKREGAGYNEDSILTGTAFQSASALRRMIPGDQGSALKAYMPQAAYEVFRSEISQKRFVTPDDLSDMLFSKLHSDVMTSNGYLEVSDDLYKRILNKLPEYKDLTSFADVIKAKNLTRAGIMRAFCHILLGLNNPASYYKDVTKLTHIRLLGFRKDSSDLLTYIKDTGSLKGVTKVPDALPEMDAFNRNLFEETEKASALYEYVKCKRSGEAPVPEYSKPIIII